MAERRPALLLLAGAWADERLPPQRARPEPGWHQPPHVREPAEARRRIAEQVRAGADAVTAPTFWTARPVLARYGEARRAREWTELAVRLAREAAEEAGRDVLICGSVMPQAEDFEAHAGTMADAGVDVLLVELTADVAQARAATLAAAATGLPVWTGARLESGEWLGEWVEAVEPAEPERLLVYADSASAALAEADELARLTARASGVCLTRPAPREEAEALLERGVTLLGLAGGARPDVLRSLREAMDARLEAERAAAQEARAAWRSWVDRAAELAPGGAALWLGDAPQDPLPAGFAWTVAPAKDAGRLPEDHFRLLVVGASADAELAVGHVGRLLQEGGVLLGPRELSWDGGGRIIDRSDDPPLAIVRRE